MFAPTGMVVGAGIMPRAADGHASKIKKPVDKPKSEEHAAPPAQLNEAEEISCSNAPSALRLSSESIPSSRRDDEAFTKTDLQLLPETNALREMAIFLKTTGPECEISQEHVPKRTSSMPKSALRFFRGKGRKTSRTSETGHDGPSGARPSTKDATNATEIASPVLPDVLEQKVTQSGKRYLQITGLPDVDTNQESTARNSHGVFDSEVSAVFIGENDEWGQTVNSDLDARSREAGHDRVESGTQTVRMLSGQDNTPVRAAASEPPTPVEQTGSQTDTDIECSDRFTEIDRQTALFSNPRSPIRPLQRSRPSIGKTQPDQGLHTDGGNFEILQPSPRRASNHPVLRDDTAGSVSSYPRGGITTRSNTASPGPPPPKSPLRSERAHQSLDRLWKAEIAAEQQRPRDSAQESNYKVLEPSIFGPASLHSSDKDPKSASQADSASSKSNRSSEILFARRWPLHGRQRSIVMPVTDAVVNSPSPQSARRRLRRVRGAEPAPLDLDKIRVHTSIIRTNDVQHGAQTPQAQQELPTEYLHILTSQTSQTLNEPLRERPHTSPGPAPVAPVPDPRAVPLRKPVHIATKGRKSPAPRPRSARMPPRGMRAVQTPPRSKSPTKSLTQQDQSDLPSPPPNRELPPTPDRNTCQQSRLAGHSLKKIDTSPPLTSLFPSPPSSGRSAVSGAASSSKSFAPSTFPINGSSQGRVIQRQGDSYSELWSRLDGLERHNRKLEAALLAVLKTDSSGQACGCGGHRSGVEKMGRQTHAADHHHVAMPSALLDAGR